MKTKGIIPVLVAMLMLASCTTLVQQKETALIIITEQEEDVFQLTWVQTEEEKTTRGRNNESHVSSLSPPPLVARADHGPEMFEMKNPEGEIVLTESFEVRKSNDVYTGLYELRIVEDQKVHHIAGEIVIKR